MQKLRAFLLSFGTMFGTAGCTADTIVDPPSNALSAVVVSSGVLTPAFSPTTHGYAIATDLDTVTVVITAKNSHAAI